MPGLPVHQLPEFTQTHVHRVGDTIQPSHPLSSPSPAFNQIRWPKYWSLSFSISPSNEYSGLISFRIDCFHLLAVQRTLKMSSPIPRFKSINSSALSLLYGSTLTSIRGKTTALTIQTSIGKVMSMLFNILSSFVIAFLPRSNHLLISWLCIYPII